MDVDSVIAELITMANGILDKGSPHLVKSQTVPKSENHKISTPTKRVTKTNSTMGTPNHVS